MKQSKRKKPLSDNTIHVLSILITLIILIGLILLVVFLIVPNMMTSITAAYRSVMDDVPQLLTWLEENEVDTSEIRKLLTSFDISTISNVSNLLSQTFGFASQIAGTIFQVVISCILALYILFDMRSLKKWALKIAYAFIPEKAPAFVRVYKKMEKSYFLYRPDD